MIEQIEKLNKQSDSIHRKTVIVSIATMIIEIVLVFGLIPLLIYFAKDKWAIVFQSFNLGVNLSILIIMVMTFIKDQRENKEWIKRREEQMENLKKIDDTISHATTRLRDHKKAQITTDNKIN